MQQNYIKLQYPSFITFTFITILFLSCANFWDSRGINHIVIVVGNLLLYALSLITFWMNLKAIKSPNPNVFTNSVMGGTVLKLFVLGIATMIYMVASGTNKSLLAIFTDMFLYLIYTALDVRIGLRLNKKQ